jgi:hypothetical protein
MAKRTQPSKPKRVKALARKRIGSVAPSRVLDERVAREKPKHKKQIRDEDH